MKHWRRGSSFRASFISCSGCVMLGLVPSSAPTTVSPRLVALPPHEFADPNDCVDPELVLAAVTQAVREVGAETGVTVRLESIEYVPNDAPRYNLYYAHARRLVHWIATGVKPASS